ncbi:MAG TPA: hypothetical protein DCM28_03350, partial [Phycisphaerales bacterium]|nr:hypothetical protein [Phycisphaerales bacterium]
MAALAQDTTVPITPVAPQPQTPVVTETAEQKAQKRDMDLLMSVLVETKLSMDQRREAALSLLRKGWDQAVSALVDEFHKPSDPSNQQVIA